MARTPGYLQKRGRDRYRVRLCVGGRRFSYTLRTGDRAAAEQFAKAKQTELERQFDRQAHGFARPTRGSELADRLELRDGNPVARVPAPKADGRDPVLLSDAQYEALLTACADPVLQLYALTLGETGTRCESEALWLRWEDVDLDAGFLKVAS